jgi:hypothetical protein
MGPNGNAPRTAERFVSVEFGRRWVGARPRLEAVTQD